MGKLTGKILKENMFMHVVIWQKKMKAEKNILLWRKRWRKRKVTQGKPYSGSSSFYIKYAEVILTAITA